MANQKSGQWVQSDFFDNTGGLNITDSPLRVAENQATGGANFDYKLTGGFPKRRGHAMLNTRVNTVKRARGLATHVTTTAVKTIIRAAETKIQTVLPSLLTFNVLTEDTATAGSDVFPASTSTTTAFTQFNGDTNALLVFAGNTPGLYAVYNPDTKYTKVGADPATGTISATTTTSTGTFISTGNVAYAVQLHKASTGAVSNCALDILVSITTTLQVNTINLAAITSLDTTKYDQFWIYRSAVGGVLGFTTGSLIAKIPSTQATYVDNGSSLLDAQNIPRAGNIVLDNSPLPAGTYNTCATWKRRLVTSKGNTLYYSDLNKPESFPLTNTITVPSGTPITALAVISFNTDYGSDEYLAVFKERELWLVRGNSYTDVSLSFIDSVGCPGQNLISLANGYLTWLDYRGVFLWDGSGKPIYTSQPIEALFAIDGDLDKPNLQFGCATYIRKKNQVIWYVSHKTYGYQKFAIKMDMRLTLPYSREFSGTEGRLLKGVFAFDSYPLMNICAAHTYLPSVSLEERTILADNTGFIFGAYEQFADGFDPIEFSYVTPFHSMGNTNAAKRFYKVIVWVEELGNWNLSLDYWSGYRAALNTQSTLEQPISTVSQSGQAQWDVAFWDTASWDDYTPKLTGLVFNLHNDQGNAEGDCIRLRFRQYGLSQPVSIYGYSILWAETGLQK